jgi:hypothetical protein
MPAWAGEPFSHFVNKPVFLRGRVKLPVFKAAIAFRFGMGPDSAVAHYEKKALDPNTLSAVKKAAGRHKAALETGEGSQEAGKIAADIADMKERLGRMRERPREDAMENEDVIHHIAKRQDIGERYMKMLEAEIAKREKEARHLGMDIGLAVLADGLMEAGRKNREGRLGTE